MSHDYSRVLVELGSQQLEVALSGLGRRELPDQPGRLAAVSRLSSAYKQANLRARWAIGNTIRVSKALELDP